LPVDQASAAASEFSSASHFDDLTLCRRRSRR
jgi:hypothetical protein